MKKMPFHQTLFFISVVSLQHLANASNHFEGVTPEALKASPLPLSLKKETLTDGVLVSNDSLIKTVSKPFLRSIVWKGMKALTTLLAFQNLTSLVSASYVFEGTEEIGKNLATYFSTHKREFAQIVGHPDKIYEIDNKYILQLHKKKGFYVTLQEDVKLYDGDSSYCIYNPHSLVHDMECCEIEECGITSHKNIKFLVPKIDPAYSDGFPTIEVNTEFTPLRRNKGIMCSLAKKVRFFFSIREKDLP